jgi:HAD superfamily hydrolase (TIGR01509 family)
VSGDFSSRTNSCGSPPPAGPDGRTGLAAVLFDMDGLLVDSEPLWLEVEKSVMARLGGTWTSEDQRALLGGSLHASVGYMLGKAPAVAATREAVGRWLMDGMAELLASRGVPMQPGARELVAAVAAAGIGHALVTSSQRRIMDAVLAATGLRFDVTVCGEDVRHSKPHPEPYLRAAALLGQPPGGCVVLEDSPAGIASARAAGCPVIAVPSTPLTDSDGVVTARSLREVGLALLRAVVTERPVRAVSEEF